MLAFRRLPSLGLALLLAGPLLAAQDAAPASWPGPLPGIRNAREVAGLPGQEGARLQPRILVRSGALSRATPQALASLQAYGIRTVVDLRTTEEIAQAGADPPPFGRKPLLVRLPTDLETWIGDEVHRCEGLWEQNGHVTAALLALLADRDNYPILVHGQAGVERTGILMAAVLEIAGVPRKAILDDYVRNDGSRRPLRAGLEAVFALWDSHEGGLAGWLEEEAGVHPLVLEAVRRNLLHPASAEDARARKAAGALLKKAEKEAAGGRYSAAVKDYQKLAKKYPETSAGIVGAVRSQPNAFLGWAPLVTHGPSSNRVDVVFMGEGYTLNNMKSFDKAVKNVPRMFEKHKLFGEYYTYFNFLRAALRSEEDGIDMAGRTYSTALNGHDSGASQGQVAVDNDLVQRMLEEMPDNDQLAAVFVKRGSLGTGGGGVATVGGVSNTTLIHEWGHAFGGLMDEYSSDVGYTGPVHSGPNVSNTPDPDSLPWKHWIDAGIKGVGAFEGAAGRARGAWKPTAKGCAMEGGTSFCPICREVLVLRIYSLVDPIDAARPPAGKPGPADPFAPEPAPLQAGGPLSFQVTVLQPKNHALTVLWWVLPEDRVPPPSSGPVEGLWFGDRRDRGPLNRIEEAPAARTRADRKGIHRFTLDPAGRKPGAWRVICRVRDETLLPGEKTPWVLEDPDDLLESERSWAVRIPEKSPQ